MSTVPLGRLSENDLAFVYRQASAERSQSADQTAQYTPAGRETLNPGRAGADG